MASGSPALMDVLAESANFGQPPILTNKQSDVVGLKDFAFHKTKDNLMVLPHGDCCAPGPEALVGHPELVC